MRGWVAGPSVTRSNMRHPLRFSPPLLLPLLLCVFLLLSPLQRASAQCNPMSNLITEPNTFPFTAGNTRLVRSDPAAGPVFQATPAGTLALVNVGAMNSSSAAWMSQPFRATDGFKATFSFRIQQVLLNGTVVSPDGFAFVMLPAKTNSTSALGGVSNQIGYGGLAGSIAVEFDTFDSSVHSKQRASKEREMQLLDSLVLIFSLLSCVCAGLLKASSIPQRFLTSKFTQTTPDRTVPPIRVASIPRFRRALCRASWMDPSTLP